LLAGNDLRHMSPAIASNLLNREVIAIDQDVLGKQADRIEHDLESETWLKPLADGSVAVGGVNLQNRPAKLTIRAADLRLPQNPTKGRDLWSHRYVTLENGKYSAEVPSHGIMMLRVSPGSNPPAL
jgi:alpha-galactosidase